MHKITGLRALNQFTDLIVSPTRPSPHPPSALYRDFCTSSPFLSYAKFQFLIMADLHFTLQIQPLQIKSVSLRSAIFVCMYTHVYLMYLFKHTQNTYNLGCSGLHRIQSLMIYATQFYHCGLQSCALDQQFYCKLFKSIYCSMNCSNDACNFQKTSRRQGRPWC